MVTLPVIYYICETHGIALTTASFSGVMIGLIPVAGLILGVLFLKEKCTFLQVVFTVLSVVGVGLTTTGGFGTFSLPGFLLLCNRLHTRQKNIYPLLQKTIIFQMRVQIFR